MATTIAERIGWHVVGNDLVLYDAAGAILAYFDTAARAFVLASAATFTGPTPSAATAGGDLAGTYPNPTVAKISGALVLTGQIAPSAIGSSQNNYAPTGLSGASSLLLTASAAYSITGLTGGAAGRTLLLVNVGSYNITLSNASGSSTAANRFAFGEDLVLAPNQAVLLVYDNTNSRWRAAFPASDAGPFIAPGQIVPTILGADTNDYAPTGGLDASSMLISASAAYKVTGLTGGVTGRVIWLANVGSYNITLTASDGSSTAANQFGFVGDTILQPGQGCTIFYDGTSSLWRKGGGPLSAGTVLEAQVQVPTAVALGLQRTGHWTFDATVQTATQGTRPMIGGVLPIGAVVTSGFMYVKTSPVGSGASIAITVQGANDVITAAAISGAPWSTGGLKAIVPTPPLTTPITVASTAKTPSLVITTADLTDGKIELFLDYHVLATP